MVDILIDADIPPVVEDTEEFSDDDDETSESIPAFDVEALLSRKPVIVKPTTFESLDEASHTLLSYYIDFLADIGTSERFFIDADALLAHILSDPLIDWAHGGQYLHLVFAVESFLYALQHRHARFDLVFFDVYEPFWRNFFPEAHAARNVLILHFENFFAKAAGGGNQEGFRPQIHHIHDADKAWWPSHVSNSNAHSWTQLIADSLPSFLLTEYGWPSLLHTRFAEACPQNVLEVYNDLSRLLVHASHLHHVDIMLLDQFSFRGAGATAFFCQVPLSSQLRSLADLIERLAASRVKEAVAFAQLAPLLPTPSAYNLNLAVTNFYANSLRVKIGVSAMLDTLRDLHSISPAAGRVFADVFSVTLVLSHHLPLKQRAFVLPTAVDWQKLVSEVSILQHVQPFLRQLASSFSSHLSQINLTSTPKEAHVDIADLFDGRLFHLILLLMIAHRDDPTFLVQGLSSELKEELIQLRKSISLAVAGAAGLPEWIATWGDSESLCALEFSVEDASKCAHAITSTDAAKASQQLRVPDILNPLTDSYIEPIVSSLHSLLSKAESPAAPRLEFPNRGGWDVPQTVDDEPDAFVEKKPVQVQKGPALSISKQILKEHRAKQKAASGKVGYLASLLVGTPLHEPMVIAQHDDPVVREKAREEAKSRLKREEAAEASAAVASSSKDESKSDGKKSKKEEKEDKKTKADEKKAKADEKKGAKADDKGKGTTKKPVVSKTEQIRADNNARKADEAAMSAVTKVDEIVKRFGKGADKDEAMHLLQQAADKMDRDKHAKAAIDIRLKTLDYWLKDVMTPTPPIIRRAFLLIQTILRSVKQEELKLATPAERKNLIQNLLSTDAIDTLEEHAKFIGLKDLARAIRHIADTEPVAAKGSLPSLNYQMSVVPENLGRPVGSAADRRLPFRPDDWQRKLLDVVDAELSALIIAPTSSGKTFIAYYAMESILRLDSESVVVFVSPTKPLVVQVSGEIEARFEKTYRNGRSLVGSFDEDYRENEDTCQILVASPEGFEVMLLNPKYAAWTKRIKYVIFDEIHCISGAGGQIWEQLLLMIDAPFLALSATLGDSSRFSGWLKELELRRGRRLVLIEHTERFNDLAYHAYTPSSTTSEPNLTGDGLVALNALWTMDLSSSRKPNAINHFPPDLRLLPEQCFELYNALKVVVPDLVTDLDPAVFFPRLTPDYTWNLSMRDARQYEEELKRVLKTVLSDPAYASIVSTLAENVPNLQLTNKAMQQIEKDLDKVDSEDYLTNNFLSLIETLYKKQWLPGIAFHWSSRGCEKLAIHAASELQRRETEYRAQPEYQKREAELLKEIKDVKQRLDKLGTLDKIANGEDSNDFPQIEKDFLERYEDAQRRLKLLDQKTRMRFALLLPRQRFPTKELLNGRDLLRYSFDEKNPLHNALLYGIGVYHPGLSKRMRRTVENLFRSNSLAIVISTATLSLGINMPCKTVILAGDAAYLNGLNYRQMAGRAGRRGFDLRGNVVFFGVRPNKISRLVRSQLPSIRSNVQMSATLALRMAIKLATLADQTEKKAFVEAVHRVLECAPFASGPSGQSNESGNEQVLASQLKLTFRLTLDLLSQAQITNSLAPNDLTTLIAHLYFIAPNDFTFQEIIVQGHLAKVVQSSQSLPDIAKATALMTFLSQLVQPLPLPRHWTRLEPSVALVCLPPIDETVSRDLKLYNQQALDLTVAHWASYARCDEKGLGADTRLPLSGHAWTVLPTATTTAATTTAPLLQHFAAAALPVRVRSAFVATSGHGDRFESLSELFQTQRRGLHIDPAFVPSVETGEGRLNAYLLDFYNLASPEVLEDLNHIRPEDLFDGDDIYQLIQQFNLTLKSLADGLIRRNLSGAGVPVKGVAGNLTQLHTQFQSRFAVLQKIEQATKQTKKSF